MRAAGGDERRAGLERSPRRPPGRAGGDMRSSRAASEPVKPARHVLDDQGAAPRRPGSAGTSSASARGPPVEQAITTARGGAGRGRGGARCRGAAWPWPLPLPLPTSRRGRAPGDGLAQPLGEVLGEGLERLADRGLGHEVEGALGERVDRAGAVGGREGADDDDGHVGRAASFSARRTPMPSSPGMARSRVMASGCVARHSASASSPSRAVPTTSKPAAPSAPPRTVRMNGESSATTMRGAAAIGG